MINRLSIKNYKSIKHLNLNTKRVNLFIGEHNSGKSNILEALNWFSVNALNDDAFKELFRYKNASNFFYDFDGTQTIEVNTDELTLKFRYARNSYGALMNYFEGIIFNTAKFIINDDTNWNPRQAEALKFTFSVSENKIQQNGEIESKFRTYLYKRLLAFELNFRPYLNPPFGANIPNLLQSDREWKKLVSDFFKSKGFRLVIKPIENEIEMAKDVEDELYSFPYSIISETMQRFIFLLLAIESNKNSILVLDEPESNMYPFFIKDFAERIANNESNQYFIATHNPYLLTSLLDKTPLKDIAVYITRMENYKTSVEVCSDDQINEMISLGSGTFFNLDNIREKHD